MMYAMVDGARVEATKRAHGTCPSCGSQVIPKCGRVRVNHWAHACGGDCDIWHQGETKWHRKWKERFPADWREVGLGNHRADVLTPSGWVLEFQNSPISLGELESREQFYGDKMLWIINGQRFIDRFHVYRKHTGRWCFDWRWRPASWQHSKRTLVIDNAFAYNVERWTTESEWYTPDGELTGASTCHKSYSRFGQPRMFRITFDKGRYGSGEWIDADTLVRNIKLKG